MANNYHAEKYVSDKYVAGAINILLTEIDALEKAGKQMQDPYQIFVNQSLISKKELEIYRLLLYDLGFIGIIAMFAGNHSE